MSNAISIDYCKFSFRWTKKKSKYFIIPSTFFKKKVKVVEKIDAKVPTTPKKEPQFKAIPKVEIEKVTLTKSNLQQRSSSAFSLKSVHNTKEKVKKEEVEIDLSTLPKDDFSIKEFKEVWNNYIEYLRKKGEKLLLSILSSLKPEIEGSTIKVVLSNSRIQNDIESNKHRILHFLRENLNHYALDFAYEINEEEEKEK